MALFRKSYFRNSLNILSSEILEFDENISDHVRARAQGSQQFNLKLLKIKAIFERLFVLGQAEEYLEGFYNFINK